ncbi:MAG: PDZ domain-containing protein [Candidatus Kapaibacteriota bacterium]
MVAVEDAAGNHRKVNLQHEYVKNISTSKEHRYMNPRAALFGLLIAVMLVPSVRMNADDANLRSILQNYRNYKYSNIQVLEVSGDYSAKLREFFKEETKKSAAGTSKNAKLLALLSAIASKNPGDRLSLVDEANNNQEITEMRNSGEVSFEEYNAAIDEAVELSLASGAEDNNPDAFFLITTRKKNNSQQVYIGLLPAKRVGGKLTSNLQGVQFDKAMMLDDIYLQRSLEDKAAADYTMNMKMFRTLIAKSEDQRPELDERFSMDQFLGDLVQQGSYRDRTLDLQEIDNIILQRQETGIVKPLENFRDETKVRATTSEIQSYQRVSQGQAFKYNRENEIILGYDLVSWRRYAPSESQLANAFGYLGAETEFKVQEMGGERTNTEVVVSVEPGSPAESAGLEVGDVITAINGKSVSSDNKNRVAAIMNDAIPGQDLKFVVMSASGQRKYADVELSADLGPDYYANQNLPVSGVELRYGLDQINYPSIWSERATVSYVYGDGTLGDAKLGVILPNGLWSNTASNFATRRFTQPSYGGIATDLNFSTSLFKNSGVFNFGFSYVFGDATKSDFGTHPGTLAELLTTTPSNDYLVRMTGRLQYTFALSIDEGFQFRFGLGPTMYIAETWSTREDTLNPQEVLYEEIDSETIFDFSGRIEFMSTSGRTPFGGSINYFDRTLGGNLYFQFPIVQSSALLALRLEGQWFWTAMRDPRPWEQSTVFIPTARIVWNF